MQKFKISGSKALKKAFIEELGLKLYIPESIEYLYLTDYEDGTVGGSVDSGNSEVVFELIKGWDEAVKYVKNLYSTELKIGDKVIIDNLKGVGNGIVGFIGEISKICGKWYTLTPFCIGVSFLAQNLVKLTEENKNDFKNYASGKNHIYLNKHTKSIYLNEYYVPFEDVEKVYSFLFTTYIKDYRMEIAFDTILSFGCQHVTVRDVKEIYEFFI